MKKVKRNSAKKLSVSGVIIIACTTAYGQQNDSLKTKQLNPVVISATRMEKNPDSIGRSISVINSQQLHNSVFNSLGDVLAAQENIYVVGIGQNPGMAQSIFMRGANSNQTEIMIDGIRIADPSSTNNAVDLSELSVANIDHVEIVRGSHSTLFGSSAIGGVINIITKKDQQPGFSGDAAIEAGTFGKSTSLLTENLSFNYPLKNGFYANAEVFATNVNGLCAAVDTITNPKTYNRPPPDNSDKME
ncbi:MAG: TonB-dependent receptor plug domain-containing protein, partial [Bacteroidales bacterium]